ncbi:MAG: toxic anion resistance protein, partial [Porphyromonadaceae bacterium]|nr:toxic anion resistance protein [Porphyromonadaceae bacterium]
QLQLLKDIALLDKMYELNLTYFKELSMYIEAGKRKILEVQQRELPELEDRAKLTGLPEDAQKVNDLSALCNRFEKKVHDLELTRAISLQMAPQIRLVQGNDTQMSEKIQSTLVNTIPLWKSQMVLAIGVENSSRAAKAQREVTDMTNELLKKNAEKLKLATIDTAKEAERGIVDIETLKATNESLISTLDEVMKIQTEGREKRRAAELELNRIEGELKQKLLQM